MTKVHGKRYAYKFDFQGLAAATQPAATDPAYKYQSDLFMSPYHHGAKLSSFMSPHHGMTSSSGKYIPLTRGYRFRLLWKILLLEYFYTELRRRLSEIPLSLRFFFVHSLSIECLESLEICHLIKSRRLLGRTLISEHTPLQIKFNSNLKIK